MLAELRRQELIVELPARGGTTRRYVISNRGKAELEAIRDSVVQETTKQLEILAFYCDIANRKGLGKDLKALASRAQATGTRSARTPP